MISLACMLIYSLYELVSVPLYCRIIWVLCSRKEFDSPFFRMIAVIGVCEMVHYAVDVLFYRLPMFGPTVGWFDTASQSRLLSLVGPWAVYFFNHPVYFLQVAISVNRLTSVWQPLKNKAIWQKLWRPLVAAAFLLSLLFTAHRLPFNATTQLVRLVDTDPEAGYIPAVVKYDFYSLDQALLTIVYNSLVLFLSLAINSATLWKILAMKKSGELQTHSSCAEVNLFIIALWMMGTLVVVIVFQLANFLVRNHLMDALFRGMDSKYALYIIYLQQPWVDDLGSMSHPWVLFVMSSAIRRAAMPFLSKLICQIGLKKTKVRSTNTVSVTNVHFQQAIRTLNTRQMPIG